MKAKNDLHFRTTKQVHSINLSDSYFNSHASEKTFHDILEPLVKKWVEENFVTEYLPRMPIIQGLVSATVKKPWKIKYY